VDRWYAIATIESVINLPLIWGAIIASFTITMLEFQCNLICIRTSASSTTSGGELAGVEVDDGFGEVLNVRVARVGAAIARGWGPRGGVRLQQSGADGAHGVSLAALGPRRGSAPAKARGSGSRA